MECGKRLSKTRKINYKALIYLLPIVIVFTIIFSYYISASLFILIGSMLSIMIAFVATQFDQKNTEAFENGLKVAIIGNIFREFIPYQDIVYICKFELRFSPRYPSKIGLLAFFKKSHIYPFFKRRKYAYVHLMDDKKTPFEAVIPNMKKQIQNWEESYHPEIILKDFKEIWQMYESWNSSSEMSLSPPCM
jgi:hypothetical protein